MGLLAEELSVISAKQDEQTPADISGGKFWMDYDNPDSYTLDTGEVSLIHDLFGVANDFEQTTPANRASIVNGKLEMNGSEFYNYTGALDYFNFMHNGSNWTWIAIAESNATETGTTDQDCWFANNQGTQSNPGFYILTLSDSTTPQSAGVLIGRGVAGPFTWVLRSLSEYPNVFSTTETMTVINFDYSVNQGDPAMEFINTSENPELLGTADLFLKSAVATNPPNNVNFGRFTNLPDSFNLKANVGVVLFYDKVLNTDELNIIKSYYNIS